MVHVTILTGASKGIGFAVAEYLLKSSTETRVVAVVRDATSLGPLVKEYGSLRLAVLLGDVTDPTIPQKALSLAVAGFGRLDAVIANAGVLDPVGPIADADVAAWRQLYDVNFFSVVGLVQATLPELRKSGNGRVVAVSSGASTKPYDGWGAYGSSKAALNHFISSVATEEVAHASEGSTPVAAISIAPGVVNTSMQEDIRNKFGATMRPEAHKRFTDLHANGELLDPSVPAHVLGKLALEGWDKAVNGTYLRYNDEPLKEYQQS